MNDDFLQKLMVSKAIMDKHNEMPRSSNGIAAPSLDNFDVPNAKYNIPQNVLEGVERITKPVGSPSIEAIKKSKLPDSVKRLMMEHPIEQQPMNSGAVLSNELIEKASKLMGKKPEQPKPQGNDISQAIEEAVRKVLKENGLLIENQETTNEIFSFRVGKHIFEGKITKIKKLK